MELENSIVRSVDIKAPISKVWDAIADHKKFGAWFKCVVDEPFVEGGVCTCRSTYHEHEELVWQKRIKRIQPETYFAYEWSAGDTGADMFDPEAPRTLVEFTLTATDAGTRLEIHESGFAELPEDMALRAFRLNNGGWDSQVNNIQAFFADA
ncbi:MAG: SRPBCC family protein [Pseudomonadota bacterium]